jgi:hypothetical protein
VGFIHRRPAMGLWCCSSKVPHGPCPICSARVWSDPVGTDVVSGIWHHYLPLLGHDRRLYRQLALCLAQLLGSCLSAGSDRHADHPLLGHKTCAYRLDNDRPRSIGMRSPTRSDQPAKLCSHHRPPHLVISSMETRAKLAGRVSFRVLFLIKK